MALAEAVVEEERVRCEEEEHSFFFFFALTETMEIFGREQPSKGCKIIIEREKKIS